LRATLPATAIAVAQPLPRKSDLRSGSDQAPSEPPDQTPAHVEEKPSDHGRMRDEFVRQWEAQYRDKYPFEPKDGSQLAAMIHKHPQLVERWGKMVSRYLAEPFWAGKRHPLTGLVTRPVEFAGDAKKPTPNSYCHFHRAPGTRGKRPPAGWIADCPECKHARAGSAGRASEPTSVTDLAAQTAAKLARDRATVPATAEQIAELRRQGGRT
jgi:hypothetical protein